jgi:hypothetical protein
MSAPALSSVSRCLAVLFAALVFLPLAPAHAAPPELPDQIAAAWTKDPLYVDPAMRVGFPRTELDRIRTAAAAAGFPVYVALIPRTPYTSQEQLDLPTLLQARVGKPGLYLVWTVWDDYWNGTQELIRPGGLKGRDLVGVQLDDKQDNDIIRTRPAPRIVRTIQQAGTAYDGRPLPAVPAGDLEVDEPRASGRSTTDKEDLSAFIGMGVGAVAGFLLVLTLVLRSRHRSAASSKQGRATSLTGVRTQADRWIPKAGRALRALEKRKTATSLQLDLRDDASARLDAAKILRKSDNADVLALAGAFVLARQAFQVASGNDLLPPCFFDPTHPSGTVRAAWSDDTEVPACSTCATSVKRGKTPQGLRVRKSGLFGGGPVPYWTLDPEDSPMVATGFGALSDDLAERVTRVYGGVR